MKFFGNITKLEAALDSIEKAIQPDLEKAGITTAMRDGKSIPVSEATVAEKYAALRAANPVGTGMEERAQLLASNGVIAQRCEKAESDLAIAQTNVGNLTREIATVKSELETSRASVTTLTQEKTNQTNLRDAALTENTRIQKEMDALNENLSQVCLAAGCLDLKDKDGKPLAADALPAVKLEAANKISAADKIKAYQGAVNAAMARTGVSFGTVPGTPPQNPTSAPKMTRDQFESLDPQAQTRFFKDGGKIIAD